MILAGTISRNNANYWPFKTENRITMYAFLELGTNWSMNYSFIASNLLNREKYR